MKLKYHHLGIPTKEIKECETYLPELKMYVSVTIPAHTKLNGYGSKKGRPCRNWLKPFPM